MRLERLRLGWLGRLRLRLGRLGFGLGLGQRLGLQHRIRRLLGLRELRLQRLDALLRAHLHGADLPGRVRRGRVSRALYYSPYSYAPSYFSPYVVSPVVVPAYTYAPVYATPIYPAVAPASWTVTTTTTTLAPATEITTTTASTLPPGSLVTIPSDPPVSNDAVAQARAGIEALLDDRPHTATHLLRGALERDPRALAYLDATPAQVGQLTRIAERYAGGNSADEALLASAALAAAGDRIGSEALAQRAYQLGATGPAVEALRGSAALSFTAPMR